MYLLEDYRLGLKKRYILAHSESECMRIPPEMKKCVVFVGYTTGEGNFIATATAFWVCRPMGRGFNKENFAYLVTGRHVIEEFIDAHEEELIVRVNLKNGQSYPVETLVKDWRMHPNQKVDAAILQIPLPGEFDHECWPTEDFATEEALSKYRIAIGEGDEVFFMGLFHPYQGERRALPIVRMGNIAVMPSDSDPVEITEQRFPDPQDKIRFKFPAYLVEAKSIGGLSGCPVFVDVYGALRRNRYPIPTPVFFLLGIMYGHFTGTDRGWKNLGKTADEQKVNMGIAIVVPFSYVLDLIDLYREEEEAAMAKREPSFVAVADSLPQSNVSMQITHTGAQIPTPSEEQFLDDLKKATRKKD
jgi:hypothetical protein